MVASSRLMPLDGSIFTPGDLMPLDGSIFTPDELMPHDGFIKQWSCLS